MLGFLVRKKFCKHGKSVPLEDHETVFTFRTLDTINQSCGLSFYLVDNPLPMWRYRPRK